MKVTSTLSRQGATTERNLKLPNFVYIALRDVSRSQNKEFTQGKTLYELLHFDPEKPCTDEISKTESFVDGRLAELGTDSLSDYLNQIKIIDVDGKKALGNDVPDDVDPDEITTGQVRVRMPDTTWEQIHDERERYLGEWIAPSLIKFVESPFNSRMERINTKQEIAEFLDGSLDVDEMESEIAVACVTGESDRFTGISKVYTIINDETVSGLPDGTTLADMKAMTTEEFNSYGLTQKNRRERAEQLESVVESEGLEPSEEEMIEIVRQVYDVGSQPAREYVEMMELDWISGVEVEGVFELAKEIKSDHVELITDDKHQAQSQRMPIHEFLMVNKEALHNADGRYETREEAEEALENLLERDSSLTNTQQKKAHNDFTGAIEELIDKGYELLFIAEISEV